MTGPIFVGRQTERRRLRAYMDRARSGAGQVVFIAGEAGSGKTALVQTFVAQMQAAHEDLLVALGDCNAQGGLGDPYLPFREVLGVLTGSGQEADAEGVVAAQNRTRLNKVLRRSVQVLVTVGPDLVGTIVPGARLLAAVGKAVAEKTGWLDALVKLDQRKRGQSASAAVEQGRIFEQYANVLKTLAGEQPLLIVLDDLHWADEASVGLLFHLSRRLEQSPILILGTYRPDEIALPKAGERNPLEKVLAEIKRYAGDVTLDLGQTSERDKLDFVNQLLDLEPNRLDGNFRQHLFHHTGGHPLFTVELLRALQERGQLALDANGKWMVSNFEWEALPARIEGVIEERIGRLVQEERDILNVASVEGPSFTAEVVARVAQMPLRQLLKGLSQQLEKQHRLVREKGALKAGRSTLVAYQFTHTLFQRYLYGELSGAERRLLHGEVARALEEFYPQTDELSPQLAWHYDRADEPDKAAGYYVQAGERAAKLGAPREARDFFARTLELLAPEDDQNRWRVLTARIEVLKVLGDNDARLADVETLLQMSQPSGEDTRLAQACKAQAIFFSDIGDQRAVLAATERALAAAGRTRNAGLRADTLALKARAHIRLGEVEAAHQTMQEALEALEDADGGGSYEVLNSAWIVYYESGDVSKSFHYASMALELTRQLGDRAKETIVLSNMGLSYCIAAMYERARELLEESLRIGTAAGYRRGRGYGLQNLALVEMRLGDAQRAESLARASLAELSETADAYGMGGSQMYLGFVLEAAQRWAEAQVCHAEARQRFEHVGAQGLAAEASAGMARCALAQGQLEAAAAHASDVWQHLDLQRGVGIENLIGVCLACAQVFGARGDAATEARALEAGYRELIARANRISDSSWRSSFLENVPEHRELLRRWQEGQAGAGSESDR